MYFKFKGVATQPFIRDTLLLLALYSEATMCNAFAAQQRQLTTKVSGAVSWNGDISLGNPATLYLVQISYKRAGTHCFYLTQPSPYDVFDFSTLRACIEFYVSIN